MLGGITASIVAQDGAFWLRQTAQMHDRCRQRVGVASGATYTGVGIGNHAGTRAGE